MKRLTDRSVRNLKPKDRKYEVWEGNGLGIRVTPKGTKSWLFVYHFNGRSRMMTLGRYPKVSVAAAHKDHATAKEKLQHDIDPAEEGISARRAERDAMSVKDLCREYIERWAKPNKRSWEEDERILNKDVIPAWGWRRAKDISLLS